MKTEKFITTAIIISLCLLGAESLKGQQTKEIKKMAYKAYINNSLDMWVSVESKARKKYEANPENFQLLLKLTEVQYGLLKACIANKNKKTYDMYKEKASKNVETMLDYNEKWAAAHALKAGLLGVEMAFNQLKGMTLGPKSEKHIKKAIQYDKREPLAWIEKGNSKLHTPKMFGGNSRKAIESYKMAIKLFEQDSSLRRHNWKYIDTLAWLGRAYTKDEAYKKALSVYKKALEIEPDFNWVKYHLIKKVKQKI